MTEVIPSSWSNCWFLTVGERGGYFHRQILSSKSTIVTRASVYTIVSKEGVTERTIYILLLKGHSCRNLYCLKQLVHFWRKYQGML